ncbi:MAG: hypothetical protein WC205_19450 [Opitutaceae bacterium]|jgi:hypothetical protein
MHFTYASIDNEQLMQGDIISRTPAIDEIIKSVHPHYSKSDYKAFIVLTQTCDLVLRGISKRCSARYISLAAVRPFELVLDRYFEELCNYEWEKDLRATSLRNKERMRQFISRVLNNNEDEYFFLNSDPSKGLDKDCCAFLQLSVAVKAELHYEKLLQAKALQLDPSFQHKLGYLIGKMYSRVGTPDWVPTKMDDDAFGSYIDAIASTGRVWIDDDAHRQIVKKAKTHTGPVDMDSVSNWAKAVQSAKQLKKKQVIDVLKTIMTDAGLAEDVVKPCVVRVEGHPAFNAVFK